ncbi:hypothetical protein NSS60_14780 [Anoxybacillus sp. FSL W8-0382]|uniref:hypothetical protein n=1 Tax=Anoxybacillaceae TaxID=3120669 RepID=UPI00079BA820|nr:MULTISPECIES: hypothetical protein [Bacillaceae]STO36834.1 Uncharacterised protein [[Flavobacterium] thermophilum]KYD30714.1 hypothetical protein B4113_3341 [Geobacillus sp. B4113_201601]MED3665024.1 hypothetical protein [Geobacillus stearothermophilus]MED3783561.1 hypothetical protein [Geobacillus stearothermophilus]MED4332510.1 hypothetical protein [Geobacillus stearothermophilus]
MAKRKIVTWRVADTPQSDLINEWLDKQQNIQVSLTNIVLHMINRFGIKDIMDYDIQRILYQEFSSGTSKENRTVSNQNEEADNEEAEKVAAKSLNNPDPKKDRDKENQDDDNDLYKNVDINNLF